MFSFCETAEEGIEMDRPVRPGKSDGNKTQIAGARCEVRNHGKTSETSSIAPSL
jgi:hypothetical protein